MIDIEISKRLRASIESGNKIIIFDHNSLDILQLLRERLVTKNISHVEIWQTIDELSSSGLSIYVSKDVVDEVVNIYRMYDFSDKVFVISDSHQYGSLFNYVKTGLLTKQRMVDALIYTI